jgi:hypothetical protein
MISQPETAQIIQFSDARGKLAKNTGLRPAMASDRPRNEDGVTETCKNNHLRQVRNLKWRNADAVMNYWNISMKMDTAVSHVQNCNAPEGNLHPVREPKDYWTLVAKWREAWARLMLTPAPNAREIKWKRAQLKAENHKYTGLTAERIEQAIADDVEFLKAHPTRLRDLVPPFLRR